MLKNRNVTYILSVIYIALIIATIIHFGKDSATVSSQVSDSGLSNVSASVSVTSDSVPTPTSTPKAIPTATPKPTPSPDRSAAYIYGKNPDLTPVNYDSSALLAPTDDMGKDYIDKIVFICDSPTYWMGPYGLVDKTQIWTGPEGTMTLAYHSTYKILDPYDNTEKLIRETVKQHKPDYIIIALGINGISFMDEKYFTDEYTALVTYIQEVSPNTTIILQSIYPITHAYKYYGKITNAMITSGNSWILKIAEKTGCKYLDTISVLLNDDGNAKSELMQNDGLHPNKQGLQLILDYIRTHSYIKH